MGPPCVGIARFDFVVKFIKDRIGALDESRKRLPRNACVGGPTYFDARAEHGPLVGCGCTRIDGLDYRARPG
jgi:hypothetical protein